MHLNQSNLLLRDNAEANLYESLLHIKVVREEQGKSALPNSLALIAFGNRRG